MGTVSNNERNCTQKLPNLSVSHPPRIEPVNEPKPKQLITKPASSVLKCNTEIKYTVKKGMTILPIRLSNITNESIHDSTERPLNALI